MNKVKQIGNLTEKPKRENPQTYRVYDSDGISPTLSTMRGGNLQPMIIENIVIGGEQKNQAIKTDGICTTLTASMGAGGGYTPMIVSSRGRNPDNPSDRTPGNYVEQRLEPNSEGICNCITTVTKDNMVLEPTILTPKRTEYGKSVRKDYENGKIQESRHSMTELQPRKDGISNTLTTVQKDNLLLEPQYRIRKLTPLETWRLMKFADEDFYKAKFIFENEKSLEELTREKFYNILYSNLSESKKLYHIENLKIKTKERVSNSQMYRQSGNSIVVSVLEATFLQMNIKGCPTWDEYAKENYL